MIDRARLERFVALPNPSRAQRRQIRKLLGAAWDLEWRVFGQQKRGIPNDALNREVAALAKSKGHVADRLHRPAGPEAPK